MLAASLLLSVSTAALGQSAPATSSGSDTMPYNGSSFLAPNPFGPLHSLNWSDLPFTMMASESIGYNTNVLGVAQGSPGASFRGSLGDWYSTSVVGMSTKSNVGSQAFFADGTYGLTRYHEDRFENTNQYSLDAGVNWHLTSRCSGTLIGALNQYQSPLGFQVGTGVNLVTSESVNESATCIMGPYVSLLADSGLSTTKNTNGNGNGQNNQTINSLNDYSSWFVRGGIQYTPSTLDTITVSSTYTHRTFTNPVIPTVVPVPSNMASGTDSIYSELQYTRVITPKITFNGSVGVTQFKLLNSGSDVTGLAPSYSVSLAWQAFPKLSFTASDSLSVGAPTSVIASLQSSQSQSVGAAYQLSPKISLAAGVSRTTSTGASASTGGFTVNSTGAGTTTSAFCSASYTISPFLGATASYQYSESNNQQSGASGAANAPVKQNIFTVSLSYNPR